MCGLKKKSLGPEKELNCALMGIQIFFNPTRNFNVMNKNIHCTILLQGPIQHRCYSTHNFEKLALRTCNFRTFQYCRKKLRVLNRNLTRKHDLWSWFQNLRFLFQNRKPILLQSLLAKNWSAQWAIFDKQNLCCGMNQTLS